MTSSLMQASKAASRSSLGHMLPHQTGTCPGRVKSQLEVCPIPFLVDTSQGLGLHLSVESSMPRPFLAGHLGFLSAGGV